MAKVVPILKPGKPRNDPVSYRPISLLSGISKIFEKIIRSKLEAFLNENNVIPMQQFGFRKEHNTSHQVLRLSRHVKEKFGEKKSTGLVLLDVEKAFDTVWHNALIYKLITNNCPPYLIKTIESFLCDRQFIVSLNGMSSVPKTIPAGVPQGSVLSPTLFNVFTSDFPALQNCNFGMYADDIAIYSSDEHPENIICNIQNALVLIYEYYKHWRIKINAGKSQAIFFTRKRKDCFLPSRNLTINSCDIPWVSSVKYLGVYLDKKLTFKEHTQMTTNKINIGIKLLYPLINRKSLLSKQNKLIIFKVVFQAILLYGSPVWGDCAIMHKKKLQILQNKILKMILKVHWLLSTQELHEQTNTQKIERKIEDLNENFFRKCELSENTLIRNLI